MREGEKDGTRREREGDGDSNGEAEIEKDEIKKTWEVLKERESTVEKKL